MITTRPVPPQVRRALKAGHKDKSTLASTALAHAAATELWAMAARIGELSSAGVLRTQDARILDACSKIAAMIDGLASRSEAETTHRPPDADDIQQKGPAAGEPMTDEGNVAASRAPALPDQASAEARITCRNLAALPAPKNEDDPAAFLL